jgi:predicted ester cyclase
MATGDDSRKIVSRFFAEAINGHDVPALDRFCSEHYVWHGAQDESEELPEVRGLVEFKKLVQAFFDAFPDFHVDIRDIFAEGDRVTVRYVEGGTHARDFIGIRASRERVLWPGIGIFRVQDGVIAEEWFQSAIVTKLEQAAAGATA